jgi:hypothetical protein
VLKALRQGLRVDTRRVEIHPIASIEGGEEPRRYDLKPEAWHEVQVSCTLPGTGLFLAWWRPDGNDVLTLAAHLTS